MFEFPLLYLWQGLNLANSHLEVLTWLVLSIDVGLYTLSYQGSRMQVRAFCLLSVSCISLVVAIWATEYFLCPPCQVTIMLSHELVVQPNDQSRSGGWLQLLSDRKAWESECCCSSWTKVYRKVVSRTSSPSIHRPWLDHWLSSNGLLPCDTHHRLAHYTELRLPKLPVLRPGTDRKSVV